MSGQLRTAEDFFTAAALAEQDVPLPGGKSVRARELSVLQRAEFARRSNEDPQAAGAWLVAVSCIDHQGFRMFTDEQAGDLMLKSPRIVEHVALAVMRLSGLIRGDAGNV